MKIQVTQENLSKAISAVARAAVSSRNPLPILNNILLRTENNRLTISATNLEIAITEHIGAKVTHEGAITVPAKLFQEFISSLPSGTIDIDTKEHKCTIAPESNQLKVQEVRHVLVIVATIFFQRNMIEGLDIPSVQPTL